ncbi:MAG: hypothetical protein RLZZ385_1178 [Pseudomonadota bacterium]|jgi:hypothetical protein
MQALRNEDAGPDVSCRMQSRLSVLPRWILSLELIATSLILGTGMPVSTQVAAQESSAIPLIPKVNDVEITVDGNLTESLWDDLADFSELQAAAMQVVEPDTLQPARHQTQTRLFYTDRGLYVGIRAEQPVDTLVERLSSRDGDINRDGIILYLDTSGEGRYGYFFGVNLGGTLVDGTLLPERQTSALWDGPWSGQARQTDNGYSVEMFLPWSMLAMPQSVDSRRRLGVAVTRRVAYLDETWGQPALPGSQARFISGLAPLMLDDLRAASGRQFTLYPFVAVTRDRMRSDTDPRVGTDVYWRPSSNLQVSATVNPDFGVVESDDVIVNLTAFETFYPEKRPFFLEGNEIFVTSPRSVVRGAATSAGARSVPNSFNLEPTTLLNSRRIGGAPVTPTIPSGITVPAHELSKPSELLGAAKITGQQGLLRYGVMLAAEEDTDLYGRDGLGNEVSLTQQGRDFGILRLLYEDSSAGRRGLGFISTLTSHPSQDAATQGVDLHYINPRSSIVGDVQLLRSAVEGQTGYGGYFDINYIPRQGLSHRFSMDYLDEQLDISDLGFLRRNDAVTLRYTFNKQSSASDRFRFTNDNITVSHETNTDGRMVSASLYYRNTLTFLDRNQLNTTAIYRPARWDDRTSLGHGDFRVAEGGQMEITYGTDTSRLLSASIGANAMSESLGDWSWTSKGGITFKPNDRFSMDLDFSYRRARNWIIHLNGATVGAYDAVHWQPALDMDFFFTARQQLQFSLQWVGIKGDAQDLYQVPAGGGDLRRITAGLPGASPYDLAISRTTFQLRYRWELAPLSDLFVVYTRGGNVPRGTADEFGDLFQESITNPIIDRLVVKLRYRFGS